MTSERKVAANRANARRSTGPKTPDGKAVAARNATRHAILQARLVATADEDAGELAAFGDALAAELAPVGPLEGALVGRVVGALWRLRRVQRAEAGLFDRELNDVFGKSGPEGVAVAFTQDRETFATLARYERGLERSLYAALHELQRLQAARAGEGVAPPAVVDVQLHGLPDGDG